MGKLMGIDFGDVRTGVATSDPMGLIATGAGCIKSTNLRRTAEMAAQMAKEKGVDTIIVGHPINMNGTLGPRAEKIQSFVELLGGMTDIPISAKSFRFTILRSPGSPPIRHASTIIRCDGFSFRILPVKFSGTV